MRLRRRVAILLITAVAVGLTGCGGWRGANTLPLPGTAGAGPDAYQVQAQLPDVSNIERNSRVRVGDVTVGNVSRIERQGWHALLTMTIDGDVELPANSTATIGQTSLFGSLHVELAPPTDEPPRGKLGDGSLISLAAGESYPTTEQALAAVSVVLNGGGVGRLHEITEAFSTAFSGREDDLRNLIEQLDHFVTRVDAQKDDILASTESLDNVVAQFAAQEPVLDRALTTIPNATTVLADQRAHLVTALEQFGQFSELSDDAVRQSSEAFLAELRDVGPVIESLADAGPAMTRSLSLLGTFPWPKETIHNWFRGDYANLTAIFDLTLSRLDTSLFTGTRWEGDLTELEMQWGRTIGQLPSPATAGNPLVIPYQFDQGP
ncbi:MCE family protein [Mycolicibacterium thermoresistibile]